jgi:predicted nucleic acid-binding protein
MNPAMPAQTLYLDTSVIGGYHDAEFMADTRALWRLMERGAYRFYTSRVAMNELRGAPLAVRELAARAFSDPARILDVSADAFALAQAYLAAGVVPAKFGDDAVHVAVATCQGIGVIVSWNFKHLASFHRNERFNAVNLLHRRPNIRILPPSVLLNPDEDLEEEI